MNCPVPRPTLHGGNGMGTIVARPNRNGTPSYQVKIRLTGLPTASCSFSTQHEAEAWMQSTEAELKARSRQASREQAQAKLMKKFQEQPRIVADVLHRYLKEETIHKKGAETEVHHVRSILKYPLGQIHLENLTRRDIREWRDQRLQDVAASTVNRELTIIYSSFRHASREWDNKICKDVLESVRRPKNPPGRIRRLSPEEEAALRKAGEETRNPFIVPILTLALETAMRRSEILGLEWERIALEETKRSIQLIDTKNGSARGVPLSQRAIATLQELQQVAAREMGIPGSVCTGPVFPGLTVNSFKLAFNRMVKRAGLENFRFHDLRHEATSRFFEKGISQMHVAHITGHKDLRMLLRYTHLQVVDIAKMLD